MKYANFNTKNMKVQEYSKRERELMEKYMESNGIKTYSFSPIDSFEQWDGKMIDDGVKIIFEVKVRNIASDKYKTAIIDKVKYDFLMDYTKDTDVQPFIFIFYNDGKVLRKNLKKTKVKTTEKAAPIMTAEDKGKRIKELTEIPILELNLETYEK